MLNFPGWLRDHCQTKLKFSAKHHINVNIHIANCRLKSANQMLINSVRFSRASLKIRTHSTQLHTTEANETRPTLYKSVLEQTQPSHSAYVSNHSYAHRPSFPPPQEGRAKDKSRITFEKGLQSKCKQTGKWNLKIFSSFQFLFYEIEVFCAFFFLSTSIISISKYTTFKICVKFSKTHENR